MLLREVRWLLALGGLAVTRSTRFGIEPFGDIRRLASQWNYTLDVFFDVGANDGETALKALSEFPSANVFSFEPHPATFRDLISIVGKRARFHAFNLALGSECKELEMFEYGSSDLNSLIPNAQFTVRFKAAAPRTVPVQCMTLDRFCVEHAIEKIDILKIDTEGFDLVVLQGSIEMLRDRKIRFIYVEFNDLQLKDGAFGGALFPFDDFLRPFGFRFVAAYNDLLVTEGEMFSVSNALFALPPTSR